jgi:ABC-2 type transport system ATP-binding protein
MLPPIFGVFKSGGGIASGTHPGSHGRMIEVEGLTKRYGRFTALDGVSFAIRKGEVVGLLGPNGAGKSTTMKILTCFVSATAGRASVAGFDTFDDPLKVRERIGYLPENCPLYPDAEVTGFLEFCARVRGIAPKARKAALERVIADCSLEAVRHRPIGQLSKGYRQRVGLAQALLHDPDVLILDEPTSGLDPNQIRDILGLIARLGGERTVIHSTHILSEVEATSDRVLIINKGRIVAEGAPRELAASLKGAGAVGGAGPVVRATLRGPGVLERLAAASFVASVEPDADADVAVGDGFVRVRVQGRDGREGRDLSVDLYRLAAESGWDLSELRPERARLEEVFAELTLERNAS